MIPRDGLGHILVGVAAFWIFAVVWTVMVRTAWSWGGAAGPLLLVLAILGLVKLLGHRTVGFAMSKVAPAPQVNAAYRVAVHEAGHALLAVVSGYGAGIEGATIVPDGEGSLGAVLTDRTPTGVEQYGDGWNRSVRAQAVEVLAGLAAEYVVFGDDSGLDAGGAGDRSRFDDLATEAGLPHTRKDDGTILYDPEPINALAAEVVRLNRDLLEGLVQALMQQRTLDGTSVPSLLATARSTTSLEAFLDGAPADFRHTRTSD